MCSSYTPYFNIVASHLTENEVPWPHFASGEGQWLRYMWLSQQGAILWTCSQKTRVYIEFVLMTCNIIWGKKEFVK